MMNTRIPYSHILFTLILATMALLVGMVLLNSSPSTAAASSATTTQAAASTQNS